jgi:hypothetical protein
MVHRGSGPTLSRGGLSRTRVAQGTRLAKLARREDFMDHYIPKRRIPVTLWSSDLAGLAGSIFLDLDAAGNQHQTLLEKLNESARFLPIAVGPEGRIHLVNKRRVTRVTAGRQVVQSDVFARGFKPWREEAAELLLGDGTILAGRVWMPLERATQRISDFMNEGGEFVALLTPVAVHLVNVSAIASLQVSEVVGAPLARSTLDGFAATH